MTLSRWRRIATGIAAGVIVLCAALVGGSMRSDNAAVSIASDLRPAVVIPIEEDPVEVETSTDDEPAADASALESDADTDEPAEAAPAASEPAATDEPAEAAPAASQPAATDDDAAQTTDDAAASSDDSDASAADEPLTEPVRVTGDDASAASESSSEPSQAASDDTTSATDTSATATESAPAAPAAPITSSTDGLGTGGGVDDAECALDRLVIYAGARRGGVAGSIRAALAQAGFGAGCPTPVTVLASNCPLQFSGRLGAGSGYDPTKSFVAASDAVDRSTMTSVMGTVGYSGSQIDILDFGFVNPDAPGEQWIAIFVPPSFAGWESLATRAGLAPTAQSLCSASGQLAG